jgi:hypothetical protein
MVRRRPLLKHCPDDNTVIFNRIVGLLQSVTSADISEMLQDSDIRLTSDSSPVRKNSIKDMIGYNQRHITAFNKYPKSGSKYDEFVDLLEHLLVFSPDKRYSVTEALNHDFFRPYRNLIKSCRRDYPPSPSVYPKITIRKCIERKWATKIVIGAFNKRGEALPWYTHRIIFHAMYYFDRYLDYLHTNVDPLRPDEGKAVGRYLDKETADLYFLSCIYLAIKYFGLLTIPISFDELVSEMYRNDKSVNLVEDYETNMIKTYLGFDIYQDTPYEAADKHNITLNEYDVRDLLVFYIELFDNSKDVQDVPNPVNGQDIFNMFLAKFHREEDQ